MTTAAEAAACGFNLYRTGAAAAQPRPADLLPFVPSQAPGASQGAAYSFQDSGGVASQTYWYWLEDVDLSGATKLHGPISVTYAAPTAVTLSLVRAGNGAVSSLSVALVLPALATAMLLASVHAWRRTLAR